MPRTVTPKPEPKLGRFELKQLTEIAGHLNMSPAEFVILGPIAVEVDTVTPHVLAWFDRGEDEGWCLTGFEAL